MKTEYEYFYFEKDEERGLWKCFTRKTGLKSYLMGIVKKGSAKGYLFYTIPKITIVNSKVLKDIADFLDQLNKKKKTIDTEKNSLKSRSYPNEKEYHALVCKKCGMTFLGNKNRTICKICRESED
jgi:rubrerythrin